MKLPKKRILVPAIITLVLISIIGIGAFAFGGDAKAEYVTYAAERGELLQTVEVTGELSPVDEVDLSFPQAGTVSDVRVKVGDFVNPGTILAELDAGELSADVSLAQAEINLRLAGSTAEDLAIASAQVQVAEANLESARVTEENANASLGLIETVSAASIADRELTVEDAQNDLADAQINGAEDVSNAETDLQKSLTSAVAEVRSALSKADEILGVENTLFNNEFERELSATDPNAMTQAIRYFGEAADDRDDAEDAVYALTAISSTTAIDSARDLTIRALDNTDLTLLYTRRVLDATSADSAALSLDDLVAFKTSIDAARAGVQTDEQAVTNAIQTYDNAVLANTQDTAAAVLTLKSAEQSLKSTRANAEKDIATANANVLSAQAATIAREADLAQVQANYDKANAAPRNVDLAPLYASLRGAQARLSHAQIVSPIAGRITRVDASLGEAASFGSPMIAVEASGSAYEIVVNIPESDVAKVTLGDKATVTLDALGSDLELDGQVLSLNEDEKLIEGVVYYEARVILNSDPKLSAAQLRSGMSADVTIMTDSRPGSLTVPQRAVLTRDNGEKYIRVLRGDNFDERTITTGLRGDDGLTEILSGLSEGEVVVVSTKK